MHRISVCCRQTRALQSNATCFLNTPCVTDAVVATYVPRAHTVVCVCEVASRWRETPNLKLSNRCCWNCSGRFQAMKERYEALKKKLSEDTETQSCSAKKSKRRSHVITMFRCVVRVCPCDFKGEWRSKEWRPEQWSELSEQIYSFLSFLASFLAVSFSFKSSRWIPFNSILGWLDAVVGVRSNEGVFLAFNSMEQRWPNFEDWRSCHVEEWQERCES